MHVSPGTLWRLAALGAALALGACGDEDPWNDPLHKAALGATSIRVRSGGTCHRDVETEQILAEVTDAAGVADLLAIIEIDPDGSGFHCMCCGDPTIEFYKGHQLVLSLGYHHGRSVRWVEGWEGDGLLTDESATRFADWMTAHGIPGPAEELAQGRAHDRAAALRAERQMALMPADLVARLGSAPDEEAGAEIFRSMGVEGARVAFAVLGAHRGPWDSSDAFEEFLTRSVLDPMDGSVLAAAMAGLGARTPEARGCARFLFGGHNKLQRVDAAVIDRAAEAMCSEVLADAPAINRRATLAALGRVGTPDAVAILRRVLADGMPEPAPEDPMAAGSTWITAMPGWSELKDASSDLTIAAEALAEAGDRESLGLVESLLGTCPEEDRARVEAAAERLR
ncbi:MAG: hypothetical protein IPJ41_00680 [Phycisphaerales bacterium]|nr:hypothetical protein [Phycisphaerales bacterium]